MLGHDLRNPVAAFNAGLRQLAKEPQSEKAETILPLMRSSLRRMHELIDNIMMHAKSRLGGGIRINAIPDAPLADHITEVVEEIRATSPEHNVVLELDFTQPINCDAPRVAQAISNLLSNAVNHGKPKSTIKIHGSTIKDNLIVKVSNEGQPIADELKSDLFRPFERGNRTKSEGLGLGLFIASSIAVAHHGRIDVSCTEGTTTFEFKVPLSELNL